jgi:hypothetical protein
MALSKTDALLIWKAKGVRDKNEASGLGKFKPHKKHEQQYH